MKTITRTGSKQNAAVRRSDVAASGVSVLEFSEKSRDSGMFPYHIRALFDGRHENHFYDLDPFGWHIIFVGPQSECYRVMDALQRHR